MEVQEQRHQFQQRLKEFARNHAQSEADRVSTANTLIELKAMERYLVEEPTQNSVKDAQARRTRYRQ